MSELDSFEGHLRDLYRRVLDGWNRASGTDFAAPFAEDGEVIGFDGSQTKGRTIIAEEMNGIFADHATGRYVGKVRSVRLLGPDAAVLRATAGVLPAEEQDLNPALNSIQTLVAERSEGRWRVVLYQNTPAQFHGRPDLVKSLTNELRQELHKNQ
ncbi:MAG: SgcJ/EcaC family oxidoreductase [Actinobacteria bacterium]|nr:SgcJ/EcaC family oxidoreductase [Actinomycetota bacterium]